MLKQSCLAGLLPFQFVLMRERIFIGVIMYRMTTRGVGILTMIMVGCAIEGDAALNTSFDGQEESSMAYVILKGTTRCPWGFNPECRQAQGGARTLVHMFELPVPLQAHENRTQERFWRGKRYRIVLSNEQLIELLPPTLTVYQSDTDRAGEILIGTQPRDDAWEVYAHLIVDDLSLNGRPTGRFEMFGSEPMLDEAEVALPELSAQLGCECIRERDSIDRCVTDPAQCT